MFRCNSDVTIMHVGPWGGGKVLEPQFDVLDDDSRWFPSGEKVRSTHRYVNDVLG